MKTYKINGQFYKFELKNDGLMVTFPFGEIYLYKNINTMPNSGKDAFDILYVNISICERIK